LTPAQGGTGMAASTAQTTAQSGFGFGSTPSQTTAGFGTALQGSTFAGGLSSGGAAKPFNFGAAAQTTAQSGFSLGGSTTAQSGFRLGGSSSAQTGFSLGGSNTATTTSFGMGNGNASTAPKPSLFGGAGPIAAPNQQTGLSKETATVASSGLFGTSSATTTQSSLTFGAIPTMPQSTAASTASQASDSSLGFSLGKKPPSFGLGSASTTISSTVASVATTTSTLKLGAGENDVLLDQNFIARLKLFSCFVKLTDKCNFLHHMLNLHS